MILWSFLIYLSYAKQKRFLSLTKGGAGRIEILIFFLITYLFISNVILLNILFSSNEIKLTYLLIYIVKLIQ